MLLGPVCPLMNPQLTDQGRGSVILVLELMVFPFFEISI